MKGSIALIGPMGSGKSAVGAALASRLNMRLIDTDRLVVERTGRTITEIFEQDGEPAFRQLESEVVGESARSGSVVIACGGGAILDPSNVEALRAAGDIFYLKVTPAVAKNRIQSSNDRPLLAGRDLVTILSEREKLYRQAADFEIDANGSVDEVVDRIASKVRS